MRRISTGLAMSSRNANLSEGERQIVCFVRALLADPSILILDEATSAVVTRTEALILRALHELAHHQTTFIIAHRPSTLRGCDWILEIRDGTVELREAALAAHRDSPMEEVAEGV